MKIQSISTELIRDIPFLNAGKGAGSFYVDRLPVHLGVVDELPGELDAIVATADLQGRERFQDAGGGPPRLLGEVLPKRLAEETLPELRISPLRTGVLLAGDFYTVPALDRRGGSGDVTKVWQAFGKEFAWVAGVAGNHDTFGDDLHPARHSTGNLHYLDQRRVTLNGLRIAGLGGIIGNTRRPHRRSIDEYIDCLGELLNEPADILITHDGPDKQEDGCRGSPAIREALELMAPSLVVRGHAHWTTPLVDLAGGTQVLNVDARVVILRAGQHPMS